MAFHPLPQGAPKVVGGGIHGWSSSSALIRLASSRSTSVFAVISARAYPPLPEGEGQGEGEGKGEGEGEGGGEERVGEKFY
jgi:hypothetical protein